MSTLVLGLTLSDLAGAALAVPLLAAVWDAALALQERVSRKEPSAWATAVGVGGPCVSLALMLLVALVSRGAAEGIAVGPFWSWLISPPWRLTVSLWLDSLSLCFGLAVTALAVLTVLFSIGSLRERPDRSRFFSLFNALLFSLLLVLWGGELPLLLMGWEGAALATAGLIFVGRPAGGTVAGLDALAISGLGTFCLWVALLLMFYTLGGVGGAKGEMVASFELISRERALLLILADPLALLLLVSILVATAQFPVSLWLLRAAPDALVSLVWISLLGMPVAGVYLFARLHFIILASDTALHLLTIAGAITALAGAVMALAQIDSKRLLLYAVVSELGMVLVAFAAGAPTQGIYHWLVQSVAVGLIFLSVGIVQRLFGEQTLLEMTATRRELPLAFLGMVSGCASLAGILPLAGFFSRYEVLWHLFSHGHYVTWGVLSLASGITAFYAGRLLALTFLHRAGTEVSPAGQRPTASLQLPVTLMVLALFGMAWMGLASDFHGPDLFRRWLVWIFEDYLPIRSEAHGQPARMVLATATVLILFHIGLVAVILYSQRLALIQRLTRRLQPLLVLMRNSFYADRIFVRFGVMPLLAGIRLVIWQFVEEKLLAGLLLGSTTACVNGIGRLLVRLQSGVVHHYLLWFFLGAAAVTLWVLL